ncbi:MAG: hypothetical protein QE484_09005 [Rhizobium sp.]|nr:hypothetical protein [Rhizobium sp.]
MTNAASLAGPGKGAEAVSTPRDLVLHRALVPVAPAHDGLSEENQRENALGPDFNPDYFETVDALIEETYGPVTGEFRPISSD